MDVLTFLIRFLVVALVSFGLNIPLGLWRATSKKFSLSWFISIHLAVPMIYFLRVSQGIDYWTIPFFFVFAIMGQIIGGRIFNKYYKTQSAIGVYRKKYQEGDSLFRLFWLICGVLSLGAGILGIFLPVLPTTPLVLLAAFAFSKSSATFHNYLVNNKYFGPIIVNWQETRTIPTRAKIIMAIVITISITISIIYWI